MGTIWESIESTVQAIITYSGEVWNPNKTETKEINRQLDNIIKRVLMVPQSTPREVLYMETGLLDAETILTKNRILMKSRLSDGPNETMKKLKDATHNGSWNEETTRKKREIGITEEDTRGKRQTVKSKVKKKITRYLKEKLIKDGTGKSKVQYLLRGIADKWEPGQRADYMRQMTRLQTSTVFKYRTRMLEVKNNFKNMYDNLTCRMCNKMEETQEHIMEECEVIHRDESLKTTREQVFTTDPSKLKEVVKKIDKVMAILQDRWGDTHYESHLNLD